MKIETTRPDFGAMLDRQAPGTVHHAVQTSTSAVVVSHRHAPAHEFQSPGMPYLSVLAVPHYQLSQALFDLGSGWREHFCPEPQPVHVLPPDTAYRWSVNGSSMVVMLSIPMDEVHAVLRELDAHSPMSALCAVMERGFVEPLAYEAVMRLWSHVRADRRCSPLLVQSYLTCVLHALVTRGGAIIQRAKCRTGLSRAQLAAVIELIDARIDDQLSLDELASVCDMSRFHFTRLFRQSTGHAPYQYVLGRRIEKARVLLVSTEDAISDIGAAVGFGDASNFSRTFARRVGISPLRYRAAAR